MNQPKTFSITRILLTLLLLCACTSMLSAGDIRTERDGGPLKTATVDPYRPFILESIFNYYSNNGAGSFNKWTNGCAFEFPKGSLKFAIFEDGVVWGGFHKGYPEPKVGGSVYRHGIQPGKILYPGTLTTDPVGDDPLKNEYRVYRVRPDVTPTTPFATVQGALEDEARLIGRFEIATAQDLYNAYVQDWNEWPSKRATNPQGLAPFQDYNGNGTYEPAVDIPGQPGANQTLYYVANDVNSILTQDLAGCPPIGIEMHRTIWGYSKQGTLGSTVFASTLLINRSGAPVDSMFLVQWADPDLGDAYDDLVGCDTSLGLGYVYNGQPMDNVYGAAVPAVGYTLLQGPRVPGSPQDSALFLGTHRQGFRNLGVSAFVMFTQGVPGLNDPRQGVGGNGDWYNLMNGRIASTGMPFIDPTTGQPTKFVTPGDPIAGTGWIDGIPFASPNDRRMCLVTGPFTITDGDTQQIVTATTAAVGTNHLNSVSVLKSGSARLKGFLNGGVVVSIAAADTLYPAHFPITLKGSAAVFASVVPTLEWFIASKPAGSPAPVFPLDSGRAQITPDTPGVYRIGLVGSAGSATPDTAFVDLNVTSVQRPVAAFTVTASVILGDTVAIDGTATYDPNGMPFTRSWKVTGSRAFDIRTPRDSLSGYLSSTIDPSVKFVPLRTNLHTVTLDVSNGVFTTSLAKTFEVLPLASPNISVNRQLASGVLGRLYPDPQGLGASGYYGWGPVEEFGGHIWVNDGGLCAAMNFGDPEHPTHVYGIIGIDFSGDQNYLASIFSTQAFVVHSNSQGVADSWGTFTLPFPRANADTSFRGAIVNQPYLLLPCGKPGILIVDISNPGYPSLTGQYTNGESWGSTFVDGDLLYGIHPLTNNVSIVSIASLPTIAPITTINLGRSYSSITKVGQYFYLMKTSTSSNSLTLNIDTIAIYDFSSATSAVLKGTIAVPKTLNAYNRFNMVNGFDNMIVASTAEGVYLFDVSDPAIPAIAGSFLTGSYFSSVFMNASHMLAVNLNRNSTGTAESAFEGLLELHSPYTGVEEQSIEGTPSAFRLEQNYPNPFNPRTGIRFQVPGVSEVKLSVYDILGRKVAVLVNERKLPGRYEATFDGSALASGVYFYRLEAGNFVQTRKLVLLK